MANAASTIEIELEIRDAINRLGRLEGELKKSSSAMDRVANSTRKMESAFKSARNAASALVAAISVQQIAQAADTFTNFANQIRIATNSAAEAAAVQKELYRVSQTTGTAIEDTTKLYARLRVAADQLGSSQAETIRITEIVAKSLAAAGTSSTEASGALLQLAQALNSPKVQAEEFNSLIDGMPNLLKEVEKQLGLTAGSLKKFVTDGNLTNQLFKDAILGSAEAINEQFGAAQDTIATSLTRISNSFTLLIGKVEESTGIFSGTAKVMTDLAGEFDKSDGIVRDFAEGIKILGIAFDKLKQLAINLTKPLRDAFSSFTGGESNPIVTTLNYIQAGFGFLSVAAQYETQNAALNIERLTLHVRDFFIGMIANMFSFFEKVDNFFINQINKIIGYYNSAANAIGMDGDVAPIATSTEAQESALKFERDSAFELAENYRKSADLWTQYKAALEGVAGEFRGLQNQIDSGTLIKTEEQLGNVNLEAANAASSVEKLKEKIEEVKEIEYTDFTGKLSQEQQDRFTEALEEEFRIRREMGQLTEEQQGRFTQGLEEEFRRVTEINALTEDKNRLYEESLFPKARELTYLEEVTAELKTQLLLQGQLNEEAERTAGAIVSGVSGAGPNASRATNIAQSKTVEEAAAKLILSNEKVAAAIDKSFEILFDILDPLIDILGDLLSAINRLIGALLEGAGNAIENLADSLGFGPNSYYGGGGFTRDIEALGGGAQGGVYQPSASEAVQIAAITSLREIVDGQEETLQNLIDAAEESGNLTGVIEAFKNSINNLIPTLINSEDFPEEQTFEKIITGLLDNWVGSSKGQTLQEVVEYLQGFIDSTSGADPRAEAYLAVGTAELIIQELAERIAGSSTSVTGDFQGVSDLVIKTAQEQIDAIHFQNLTAQEQIDFRNEETLAILEQQKILIELVADEEKRTQLLAQIQAAETKQLELYNLQTSELQKLNEEREREAALMLQQQGQSEIDKIISNLEKTFDSIFKLVESLRDQATGLLFGSSSTLTNQQKFQLAASEYQELLAAALDPEATEENVKDFQDFVDTYLQSAADVFKSSSQYQNIFNSVLADLEEVADFVSIAMPANEIERVKDQLVEIAEEFGVGIEEVINGLDQLTFALAYSALVASVPVKTVIDATNSDLVIEAVVTAVADEELSDTQIEAIVTAAEASGSDTVIEAVVTAVEDKQLSQTEIQAIVTAIAAAGSDTQIDAVVTAIMSNQSDTQIEAVISAIATNTPVISALVDAIAANIPVISARIEIETDDIDNTIDRLGAVLQSSVNTFVTFLNQSTATVEGEALSTLQAFSQGGSALSGVSYTSFTDKQIATTTDLSASPKDLAYTYLEKGKADNPYAIFLRYKDSSNQLWTFTDLNYANSIFDSFTTGSPSANTSNVQKIGFRQGGLVHDPMDTIPAMLSPGEYILSPETVRRYGVSNLNRLNSGDTAALNATSDPEVKRLLAELIVAVRENDTEVTVYTDMKGQTKAGIEEFRSELRERTRRQGDQYVPARYI